MRNSFYDFVLLMLLHKRMISRITLIFTISAIVISIFIPVKYKATAILMPPVNQSMNIASMVLKGSMPTDPEIGGVGYMPGMVTPSDVFAYMLESGTIAEMVIKECGLIEHYKKSDIYAKYPQKALYEVNKILKKATRVKVGEERFISLSVEDKDRNKAAEIANCYGESLDRVYLSLTMNQGKRAREFIEGRVFQEERLLKQAEDSLKTFQKRYKTVLLDQEMKVAIEISAQMEARILSNKIELEVMRAYNNDDNPQITAMVAQIDKAEQQLKELLQGNRVNSIALSKAPDIGTDFARLFRAVKIHQEVYSLLFQQLEQTKIMEAKNTPKVQFLERAAPPWKKSWPKRGLIMLFGFTVGLVTGVCIVFANEWWNNLLKSPENKEKLLKIKEMLM